MSFEGLAQSLSPSALYQRCYVQLTGQPVPRGSPTMAAVRTGDQDPIDACIALLDQVNLDPQLGTLIQPTEESLAILRNFQHFHQSWFSATSVEHIQGYGEEIGRATRDIYDTTEPALALTRSVFAKDAQYREVLTASTGFQALRQDDPKVRARLGWNVSFPSRSVHGNNGALDQLLITFRSVSGGFTGDSDVTTDQFLPAPRIQTGDLIGIRPQQGQFLVPNFDLTPLGPLGPTSAHLQPGLNASFNALASFGGGVLGMPSFLMLNYGHAPGIPLDGTLKVPRRWSQVAMENLLCAKLPALRDSDVIPYVDPVSPTPFRRASSCVQCHATLDPMGYAARNVTLGSSNYSHYSAGARSHASLTMLVSSYRADFASVPGWISAPHADPSTPFHRQAPAGRVYFRSVTGTLVNQEVTGIAQVGSVLASTDDFYQCAAKKYFEYFTGMEVPLYDRQDSRHAPINRNLSKEMVDQRKLVEAWGQKLKTNQSVKDLLKSILRSEAYRKWNYRP